MLTVLDLGYRFALTLLMLVTRPGRVAVVYGSPDYDENGLLLALELGRRYDGRVILLCADPARTAGYLAHLDDPDHPVRDRVEVIERSIGTCLRLVPRAELVLFTNPIYAAPRARGRRLHVNVWHGVGPKTGATKSFALTISVPYLCGPARTWLPALARSLRMPADTEFLPGYPRQDLLHATGRPEASLRALGLDPAAPFVVWMPTFRESQVTRIGRMVDGALLSDGDSSLLVEMSEVAAELGVQVVVKPHPLDSEDFDRFGFHTLGSEQLWDSGLSLYEFLGASDGLVSDYSSVWVEYLETDKPVGLYCPDLAEYEQSRGLNRPTITEVASGLLLKSPADVREFLQAAASRGGFRPAAHREVVKALDVDTAPHKTGRLVDEVRRLQVELFRSSPVRGD